MTIEKLIEYEKYSEQLEIELHQKKLEWLNSCLNNKDEAAKSLIPNNSPASSKYNNNSYYGEIIEITDEMTNKNGTPMRWIVVKPDSEIQNISYCLNLTYQFKDKNIKELQNLGINVNSETTTLEDIEMLSLGSLIGEKVEFEKTPDGRYIRNFIKVI